MKDQEQGSKRSFLAHEVIQTSGMDCGPVSLKCLLEGYGVPVSYGRLREACQTDVDGTSIDTLEVIAGQLGLEADQIMIPPDHLFIDEARALPAIVVIRLPNGFTHFVVVWRKIGRFIQIMDPGSGRRWTTQQRFLKRIFKHQMAVPAEGWRDYAGLDDFQLPLKGRMKALGFSDQAATDLIKEADQDETWVSFGRLDAVTRMTAALVRSGAWKAGAEAVAVVEKLYTEREDEETDTIPAHYWSVRPGKQEGTLDYTGSVMVAIRGTNRLADMKDANERAAREAALPKDLAAALKEKPASPVRKLWEMMHEDGIFTPLVLFLAMLVSGMTVMVEAILFRSLLDLGTELGLGLQRVGSMVFLIAFLLAVALLQWPIFSMLLRMGRRIEMRLRVAFLSKIPRIGDRYFTSRPASDMADRGHRLWELSKLPNLAGRVLSLLTQGVATVIGLIWLFPEGAPLAISALLFAILAPLLAHPLVREIDLRVRTHVGGLSKFYLDGLLGLIPARAHVAEASIRHQHETLTTEWARAKSQLVNANTGVTLGQMLTTTLFTIWLLFAYLTGTGETTHALLIFYWAMRIPELGSGVAILIRQYPAYRNMTLRLMEPLGAPDESQVEIGEAVTEVPTTGGVHIHLENVHVNAGGHTILDDVDLDLPAGSHVAIVGPSGAGKSSLVGLLLGWHRANTGIVEVDGKPLSGNHLEWLRRNTAWVDPAVQLWNRSLIDNLRYGESPDQAVDQGLKQADLLELLEKMPNGLQTELGEGGSLVSGGEGQRVRLGRAMNRTNAGLVILDEPFRGLDRKTRSKLMIRARNLWSESTLVCVTHDISETQGFERVLVVENARVVEDGSPMALAADTSSVYHRLLHAERQAMAEAWGNESWRFLCLKDGLLVEEGGDGA